VAPAAFTFPEEESAMAHVLAGASARIDALGRHARTHAFVCLVLTSLVAALPSQVLAQTATNVQASSVKTPGVLSLSALTPDRASGQTIGTTITWTASANGATNPVFQFSVLATSIPGSTPQILRDYGAADSFQWAPMQEGAYVVTVNAKTGYGAATIVTLSTSFTVVPLSVGGQAVVVGTANPLVALYAAPPCSSGNIRVEFQAAGVPPQFTQWQPCVPIMTNNFWVGGMRASTEYTLQYVISDGSSTQKGPTSTFVTGALPSGVQFPTETVVRPPDGATDTAQPMLLQSLTTLPSGRTGFPLATDLSGAITWYDNNLPAGSFVMRPVAGGTFLALLSNPSAPMPNGGYFLREIDLAGNSVRETSVGRVNEQLKAMGYTEQLRVFNHEAVRLPNGYTAALMNTERLYPPGTQGTAGTGPNGQVDIVGDTVVVLDQNSHVVWWWDSYNFLDVNRAAVLGETCPSNQPGGFGCPPLTLAPTANDWLHGNSISYSPADHNLIVSLRNQDWVIKIDYRDGAGTGAVAWRLGPQGDFSISAPESMAYPWFGHQHDVDYASATQLTVFDNGNLRCAKTGFASTCHSRGQVLNLDETARVATLIQSDDLGAFARGWGAAQALLNGGFQFLIGMSSSPAGDTMVATSSEWTSAHVQDFTLQAATGAYRAFRMQSLAVP
jgi:hypothetical protein